MVLLSGIFMDFSETSLEIKKLSHHRNLIRIASSRMYGL